MTLFAPNIERQKRARKLRETLMGEPDGAILSWLDIEMKSGVSMEVGTDGRDLVREVLAQMERPYLALPGDGIELSSPDNSEQIGRRSMSRVVSQLGSASEAIGQTLKRHGDEMSAATKATLSRQEGILASIRLSAKATARALPRGDKT